MSKRVHFVENLVSVRPISDRSAKEEEIHKHIVN